MKVVYKGKLVIYRTCTKKWKNCIEIIINTEKRVVYVRYLRFNKHRDVQQINISLPKAFLLGVAILAAVAAYEEKLNVSDIDVLAIEKAIADTVYRLVREWSQ